MTRTLALLALLGGCNRSLLTLSSNPDCGLACDQHVDLGSSGIDLAGSWTGIDLARPTGFGFIGAPCTTGSDCTTGVCFTAPPFTGGYCSEHIGECPAPGPGPGGWNPCSQDSVCINPGMPATGGSDYCLAPCTSSLNCRAAEGYLCCPWRSGGTTVGVCAKDWPFAGCM